ncbi:MAG: DUF1801 domain-containing protein [Pseudomonadota bacterium]|nr:DUF1801 domain-containing protein [Pseudomonadota bacterium]
MADDFRQLFERIRAIFRRHEPKGVVLYDEPERYYLGTREVRAKDGYRTWLCGVEVKKNYVSAHLIPVYAHPELLDGASEALRKRMQGKSCFNFKKMDEELVAELEALVDRGVARFEAEGKLAPRSA